MSDESNETREGVSYERVHTAVLHYQPSAATPAVALICSGCGWHSDIFVFPLRMELVDEAWAAHRAEFEPGTVVDTEPDDERRAAHWRTQAYETDQLNGRLAALVGTTVNVLKGEPPPNVMHDWSDIVEVAQREVDALKAWRDLALRRGADLKASREQHEAAVTRWRDVAREERGRNDRQRQTIIELRSERDAMQRRAEAAEADMNTASEAARGFALRADSAERRLLGLQRDEPDAPKHRGMAPGAETPERGVPPTPDNELCRRCGYIFDRHFVYHDMPTTAPLYPEAEFSFATAGVYCPLTPDNGPTLEETSTGLIDVLRESINRYGATGVARALVHVIDRDAFDRGVAEEH